MLRHLRYFAAVAEHGSIVSAARALRVAQPSLSRQIRALERACGLSLLERTRRGIHVTPAGMALLAGTRRVTEQLERGLQIAHGAHLGQIGTARVGISRGALQSKRAAQAISAIRRTLPGVELDVTELVNFTHDSALLANTVDIVIGLQSGEEDPGIRREVWFNEVVGCAMLSASHPLARARQIHASELADERLIMIDPAVSRGYPQVYAALRRLHHGPLETFESLESIYSIVATGRGWTPALTALRDDPPEGTAVVPLVGLRVELSLGVSWRANDRSRLTANILSVLKRAAADPDDAAHESPDPMPVRRRGIPRGLEARHLRALTAVIHEGSLRRARTRLGLSQSGLLRQLRALETEVGIPLFERTMGGVRPNTTALVFRPHADAVLGLLDNAVALARGATSGGGPPCRIGAVPSELTGGLLRDAMNQIQHQLPEMRIEISEILSALQVSALRNREIDIGVARAYPGTDDDPAIASVQIEDDVIESALLSASHPLASRAWLTAADLADVPFLFLPRAVSPHLYDTVMQALEQIGLTPRIEGSYNGTRAVWRFVADSLGWTLGSRLQRLHHPAGLVAIPIEGLRIPSGIQLLWRRDERDARVRAVLDTFRRRGAAAEPPVRNQAVLRVLTAKISSTTA